jgi:glycine cleavage system regulatory protein
MATLVLTVIGDDRPGLVDELAAVIVAHDASWESSSMARLASKFAGIVEVTVGPTGAAALAADLEQLAASGSLDVRVEQATQPLADADAPAMTLELQLVGQDRPGIVRQVAHALAEAGVSIDELTTWTSSAPMSGERLFEANALLTAPDDLDRVALTAALEALADELMVDIDLALESP